MYRHHYQPGDGSATLATIGICLAILFFLWFIKSISSTNAYNGGVCTVCGGKYEYQQAVGRRYETEYVYICNNCGHMITINYYAGQ